MGPGYRLKAVHRTRDGSNVMYDIEKLYFTGLVNIHLASLVICLNNGTAGNCNYDIPSRQHLESPCTLECTQ